MSGKQKPLAPLHLPLLVLLATLAGATLLDYAARRFASGMEDAQSRLEHEVSEARIRKQQARNREVSFRADAETFRQLEQRGLRGPEQRLTWVTLIETLARQAGLGRADYQLAAQRPFGQVASDEGRMVKLNASRINLTLEGDNEIRVLAFLQALEARVPGLLLPRQCQIDSTSASVALVHANCSLDWVTLDPAGFPAAAQPLPANPQAAALPTIALGRLFTARPQRLAGSAARPGSALSSASSPRPGPVPPPGVAAEANPALSGFVLRSSGSNTYWLGSSAESDSPAGRGR